MAAGSLRAVVATGSLDLGIDWGDVDLVVQVGRRRTSSGWSSASAAPTTATTRPRAPSSSPRTASSSSNAAPPSTRSRDRTLDGEPRGPGPLDVLCQHILLIACAAPFAADALYAEVSTAGPYRALPRPTSTPASASPPPAATRSAPTTAGSAWWRARPLAAPRPAPGAR